MGLNDALFLVHANDENSIILEINTKPIPKGRPRLGKYGTYTPGRTREYENLLRIVFQYLKREPSSKMVEAEMVFDFKFSGKNKKPDFRIQNPDIENLVKSVMDAGNELLYLDDSQVVSIMATKRWGVKDRVYLRLRFF